MTKLDKTQRATKADLSLRFHDAWETLDQAVTEFNSALDTLWGKVEEAMGEYNELIGEANALRQEIAQEIEDYVGERSEKWQESEKAQAYESWKENFTEDFDEVALEKPEELSLEDVESHEELIDQMPEELEA